MLSKIQVCFPCLFLIVIFLMIVVPRISVAQPWYAVDLYASSGVTDPESAVGPPNSMAAYLLDYGSYIVLDFAQLFGDDCDFWNIKIYVGLLDRWNMKIELADSNQHGDPQTFEQANWIRWGNVVLADMGGWACFNFLAGKRWRFICITNLNQDGAVITIDAVESLVKPAIGSPLPSNTDSLAFLQPPYPEDR
jgi:hypothetical protein